MGWRFRRSVKVLPGVRLNISKSGISTSIGGPGATLNIGPKGTRQTVGLPGSGVSHSTFTPEKQGRVQGPGPGKDGGLGGCAVIFIALVLLVMIGRCVGGSAIPEPDASGAAASEAAFADPTGAATNFADGDEVAISTASLRTRSEPSSTGTVVGTLHRGETVKVLRRSGEWLQVAKGATQVWIAASHVRAKAPDRQGFLSTQAPNRHHGPAKSHKRKSSGSSGFDEGCPCGGSRVCVGPRGGRYCITSASNKRYGV